MRIDMFLDESNFRGMAANNMSDEPRSGADVSIIQTENDDSELHMDVAIAALRGSIEHAMEVALQARQTSPELLGTTRGELIHYLVTHVGEEMRHSYQPQLAHLSVDVSTLTTTVSAYISRLANSMPSIAEIRHVPTGTQTQVRQHIFSLLSTGQMVPAVHEVLAVVMSVAS